MLTAIYHNLKPYEVIRYQVTNDFGDFLGFVSRYFYDGRSHWYAWHNNGLRAECRNRKEAILALMH